MRGRYILILALMLALCSSIASAAYVYTYNNVSRYPTTNQDCEGGWAGMKIRMRADASQIEIKKANLVNLSSIQVRNSTYHILLNTSCIGQSNSCNLTYNFLSGTIYWLAAQQGLAGEKGRYVAYGGFYYNGTSVEWMAGWDTAAESNTQTNTLESIIVRTGAPDAPDAPIYNYTLTQTPPDINTTTTSNINITLKVTPEAGIQANSTAFLYYKSYTTMNGGCSVYYQTSCNKSNTYNTKAMTKINNSYFKINLTDNDYLPGYYPFVYTAMDANDVRYNYSNYNNNYVKFNIFNMSTNASAYYIGLEFSAQNRTGSSGALLIYYCNSSYSAGLPAASGNCVIVDSFQANELLMHAHGVGKHYFIPIVIANITKTQKSYIIFYSSSPNIANAWNFAYMLNNTYDNKSFNTGNAATWDNTSSLFDIHFHSYFPISDYFAYYGYFYDGNLSSNQTYITYDFYNLTQFAPSKPAVLTPACNAEFTIGNSQNTYIFYNWTTVSDINPSDKITLRFCVYDAILDSCLFLLERNGTGSITNNTENVTMNTTTGYSGTFYSYFSSCDEFGNCDIGYNTNCPIFLCQNSWSKSAQPCIGGVRPINYTDTNLCTESFDIPTDNGYYENCTSITKVEFSFSDTSWLFIIMLLMMLLFTVLAFKISYIFLSFDGLIIGLFAFLSRDVLGNASNTVFIILLCTAGIFVLAGLLGLMIRKSRG